jgi:hypothetical protein
VSIAGLLERSSEDLPGPEEEVTELRLRLPTNLLDALHIHAQGWRVKVHTQRVSSQAKHTQVLRSSLRVAALEVSDNMLPRSKDISNEVAMATKFMYSPPLPFPVASKAFDITSHLAGLSPVGYMPGQTEWP